jgi:ABC-type sugar transport system substrate-binding protein
MKKLLVCLLVIMMVGVLFVGCEQSVTEDTSAADSAGDTSAADDTADTAAADDTADTTPAEDTEEVEDVVPIKIGFSFPTKNNEFWSKSLDFVEYAALELGIEVLAQDCDNKQEKQISDVENMIADGIQGLVLAPQDASVCPGITQMCKDKGIPVMIADRWPGDDLVAGEDYLGFIGPNDVSAGYAIAMALINAGCKNLVGIGGFPGTSVAEGRKEGLEKAVAENPDVTLLQYEAAGENMDQGDEAFRNMLQSFPELDGVWCYNDSHALATVNILKEKGILDQVKVGGMDLLGPAVDSIEAGELYFSTGGHWMQTGFALIMVYDAINGVEPTERLVKLDLLAVSLDNLDAFKAKYGEGQNAIDIKSISRTFNPDAKTYFELSLD